MENIERELKIVELYKQGITQKQICKECKCSTNTISDVIDIINTDNTGNLEIKFIHYFIDSDFRIDTINEVIYSLNSLHHII